LIPIEAHDKLSAEEQAEHAAYRTSEGRLFVPGVNIQRALIAGGAFSKGKGRANLSKVVAASVLISPDEVLLELPGYKVDSRPVVIPSTRGRILRHRPRFDSWGLTFEIHYDPTLLTEAQLKRIVDDVGMRVGLLDFRPEKKGPFGRFAVKTWKNGVG